METYNRETVMATRVEAGVDFQSRLNRLHRHHIFRHHVRRYQLFHSRRGEILDKRHALMLDVQIVERDIEVIADSFRDHETGHDR